MHSIATPGGRQDVDDARATTAIVLSAAGAALGGLLFGFDTAVISGATQALQERFALTDASLGFTVASALIGTVIGSLVTGAPADRYGRKAIMLSVAIAYVVSSFGTALAQSWPMLIAFRFLGGLAIGAASVVTPIYIAEVSPARFRGRLVAMNQLNIVLGILIAFLSNYLIAQAFPPEVAWRWMFGIVAVPSALFLAVTFVLPESPRWLAIHNDRAKAVAVMTRLGFLSPQAELVKIEAAERRDAGRSDTRLFQSAHSFPVACAIAIAMFNQLSGINALLYYAPRIFELAGAGADSALLQSIAVGGTNLLFTVAALFFIDRFGRRPLLIVGSVVCAAALLLVGWQLERAAPDGTLILGGLLAFIAAFAISQGAVIWVFISEVFPSAVRGKGQALGSTTHWVAAAAITWLFPIVASAVGGWVFAFFGAMMLVQLVWTVRVMPETNGVALEDMDPGKAA
ncbi:sugar porter family MFS transporter [Sphingomonas sp. SORGH_AS_0879]|uniref:sugar porter family MFS transporter n=1 Tax=Sphingomonas sp. SORGH_AS_0879 TaxID=3041790 RepID=UPI00277FD935|nr:sugar porter family MFS transporter [Sphingomonas sp. SORGH_AS_0879]MDQ1231591.1 SP family xylose:H+ symportor-like MFS transporter [Sphingomonas sp. SORGH_AS_0879]